MKGKKGLFDKPMNFVLIKLIIFKYIKENPRLFNNTIKEIK